MSTSPSRRYSASDVAISAMSNIINDENDTQQFQQIIRDRRGTYFLTIHFV
jgi:hypothetical protein